MFLCSVVLFVHFCTTISSKTGKLIFCAHNLYTGQGHFVSMQLIRTMTNNFGTCVLRLYCPLTQNSSYHFSILHKTNVILVLFWHIPSQSMAPESGSKVMTGRFYAFVHVPNRVDVKDIKILTLAIT